MAANKMDEILKHIPDLEEGWKEMEERFKKDPAEREMLSLKYREMLERERLKENLPEPEFMKTKKAEATSKVTPKVTSKVSEDLEEAIDTYLATYFCGEKEKQDWPFLKQMAIHFAKWQKQKDSIPVSEDLERAAGDYEHNMWKEGHPEDTYNSSDIIKAVKFGAQWKEQQMIAKAVDATVHIDAGGYPCIPQMELYDYEKDIPLAKEGDKVKVLVIKQE